MSEASDGKHHNEQPGNSDSQPTNQSIDECVIDLTVSNTQADQADDEKHNNQPIGSIPSFLPHGYYAQHYPINQPSYQHYPHYQHYHPYPYHLYPYHPYHPGNPPHSNNQPSAQPSDAAPYYPPHYAHPLNQPATQSQPIEHGLYPYHYPYYYNPYYPPYSSLSATQPAQQPTTVSQPATTPSKPLNQAAKPQSNQPINTTHHSINEPAPAQQPSPKTTEHVITTGLNSLFLSSSCSVTQFKSFKRSLKQHHSKIKARRKSKPKRRNAGRSSNQANENIDQTSPETDLLKELPILDVTTKQLVRQHVFKFTVTHSSIVVWINTNLVTLIYR